MMTIHNPQKRKPRWRISICFFAVLACSQMQAAGNEVKLYRYTNEQGVKVMAHSLPPKYAQKGYEILNIKGQVLEVIPAALSKSEIAAEEAKRQLREEYLDLRKRYSSADDIARAKERRLRDLETNISIIRGNIVSINARINGLMTRATDIERSGKPVPAYLLSEIADARTELTVAESSLETRLSDFEKTEERFKEEISTFNRGNETLGSATHIN